MQLSRVAIAAVFLVVGALILIPILMDASPPDGASHTSIAWWVWLIIAATLASLVTLVGLIENFIGDRFEKDASEESERVRRSVGLPRSSEAELKKLLDTAIDEARSHGAKDDVATIRAKIESLEDKLVKREAVSGPSDSRLEMLIEVYSQALTQMKSSFRLSQIFATLGALVLLIGVAQAIFRASTDGQHIAAIIATVVGVVTDLTAGLFFVQSNRARKHLERQFDQLRDDVSMKERIGQSEEIIGRIDDSSRRDELRAKIVHRILGAEDDCSGV